MNSVNSYILSFVLAVSIHAGAVALLLINWEGNEITIPAKIEPYYIEAMVVAQNPHRVKKERERKAASDRRRRAEKKKEADRQARITRERLEEKLKALAAQNAKVEEESSPVAEVETEKENRKSVEKQLEEARETERLMMEESLSLAILDEQKLRKAVTDDEKAMAYVAQIQREIIGNWSRPPSARNGMQALLRVFLVPTGEVVNVTVEDSSGNDAFDRSALLAVRKAERFIVPSDSGQFEKNFREFEVLFRPEDLRL